MQRFTLFPLSFIAFIRRFFATGAFVLMGLCAFAQEPVPSEQTISLTLSEAIEQALRQGWDTRKAQKDTEIAQADFARTKATYLPQVSLSETGVFTNSPLQAFGILLNQEVVEQADFNPALLNDPELATNFNTRLSVQQPIFNAEGHYGRKATQAQVLARQMMKTRTEKGLALQVKQAYFQLHLAQESQTVLKKAIAAAEANEDLTRKNLEQGYVQHADLMLVQLRVLTLKNQLADAENQLANASDYLAYLLNLPAGSRIEATEKLIGTVSAVVATGEISEQRSDFQAQRYALQAREQMVLSYKKGLLPRLNAFGAFEFNDDIPFGPGASNWMAGFQLQWDIFKGYDRLANTQKAQAELDKARLEYEQSLAQSKVELDKARRNVQLAAQKLSTTELAVKQAEEALRIRRDRYEEGLEKTSDVLGAEAQVAEKELEYLQNLYAHRVATFYLEFLLEN
ncbi:MAG: TolC family protein [Microscillaceae bacterium]|nr:TolC family protein [Microscillaceae bacterium]